MSGFLSHTLLIEYHHHDINTTSAEYMMPMMLILKRSTAIICENSTYSRYTFTIGNIANFKVATISVAVWTLCPFIRVATVVLNLVQSFVEELTLCYCNRCFGPCSACSARERLCDGTLVFLAECSLLTVWLTNTLYTLWGVYMILVLHESSTRTCKFT